MYKTLSKLIGNTERTIFTWKKEGRPIIELFEKYFTKDDLEEFLRYGRIQKFKSLSDYKAVVEDKINQYQAFFFNEPNNGSLYNFDNSFISLYFKFLVSIKSNSYLSEENLKDKFLQDFHETKLEAYDLKKISRYILVMLHKNFFAILADLISPFLEKDLFILIESLKNKSLPEESAEKIINESLYHFISFNIYKKYPQLNFTEKTIIIFDLYDEYKYQENMNSKYYKKVVKPSRVRVSLEFKSFENLYKILHNEDLTHLL